MKGTRALLILVAALTRDGRAQDRTAGDEREVRSIIAAFDSAWNRRDTVAVGRMLPAGYQYFTSTGQVWPRARVLSLVGSPKYRIDRADRSEIVPRVLGRTAIVSTRWRGAGEYDGKPFVDDQRCTLTLGKRDTAWELLAEHCTQITSQP